jgi:cyclohexadieny/prephenate dehydrogenase
VDHWEKVTLVGVGLLGGSLGLAIKQRHLAGRVVGYVRRTPSIAECEKVGAVDQAQTDLARAVENADLVILCTPLAQMGSLTAQMVSALKRGCLVTDVGSVKASVVTELEPLLTEAGAHFIGSHPMAGAEKMGVLAARADLFEGAVCALTPTANSKPEMVTRLDEFWKAVGARTLRLSPELHDDLVSRSSHLPHVVASELANYVLSPVHPKEQGMLCANGFRDTTRIAAGSPEMWRDICLANRKNLARVLGVFIEDLQEFQLALERQDLKVVEEFFTQAKERRDAWSAQASSSPSPE